MKSSSLQNCLIVHWGKRVSDLPMDLAALEVALRDLSHDESAVQLVRSFAQRLGKTKQRQQIFNAPGALVRNPSKSDINSTK
jgi:hypothetical protein